MTDEERETFMLETVEGLMSLVQGLVLALAKQGALDTAQYARLLLELRERQQYAPGSYQDVLFQRMLGMLVEGDPDVLVRRWGMRPVPSGPAAPPGDADS